MPASFEISYENLYPFVGLKSEFYDNIKHMEKRRKNRTALFLSAAAFATTALLLCAVFLLFGLFPFGEKTLAWGDMKQQVIPLMLDFKDILAGKTDFLLNLQNAGGMSFWGVFFFFLASPFTFLVAFFEKGDVYQLVNVLVLLKLSLAAGCASVFFRKEQPRLDKRLHIFCCVSYALCGYGLLYYQNIVWLDILCLFPLLMLGLQKLLQEGKCALFTVALILIVAVNYYLSYMVFLALILIGALFVRNCVPREKRGKAAGKIGLCACTALLVTAVVWLPSLIQCLRSARTSDGLVETIQRGGLFTSAATTVPVLLCTAAAVAAPILACFFPMTPKRKTLLQVFFLTSVPLFLEPVNKLWHTGSYQAFPARYGYIPLFFALWYVADLLCDSSLNLAGVPRKKRHSVALLLSAVHLLAVGFLILWFKYEDITSYNHSLWFDAESFLYLLLFAVHAAFTVLLGFYLLRKKRIGRPLFGAVLLAVCLIQGAYHSAALIGPSAAVPERERQILKAEDRISDNGLYRAKLDYKFTDVNLLGAAGLPTLNHYTSLTDERFLHAVKKLGFSSYWMETSASCGTKISDILLSNKYSLDDAFQWQKTGSGNLGYVVPSGVLPEKLNKGNRFVLQNELYRSILAGKPEEDAFTSYEPVKQIGVELKKNGDSTELWLLQDEGIIRYQIPVTGKETLYFDAFSRNTNRLREYLNDSFRVSVNGTTVSENYPNQRCNGILELGTFENETVEVEVLLTQGLGDLKSFGVYGLKDDKVKALTASLANPKLRAEKNRIAGTAEVPVAGRALFLSIPYYPGMKATVNGKQAEIRTVLDCFMEIPLEQGTNVIELSYFPQEIVLGGAVSLLGLAVLLLGWLLRGKRFAHAWKALWYRITPALLMAAFCGVLLVVYVLPVAVWLWGVLFH